MEFVGITIFGGVNITPPPPPPNPSLYSWGRNYRGSLGLGDTIDRSSPNQVGSLTNWYKVACGDYGVNAIKTDGTLWGWGGYVYGNTGNPGELGDVHLSSPVQVGALTNWATIAKGDNNSLAIKTNGTLWAWGNNSYGRLGLNNTTQYSSPKQVGALTNWSSVSTTNYHTVAIKTDGTLWSWGRNNTGALGLGNTTDYYSPKQVGGGTTWSAVTAFALTNSGSTRAIKTDGTMWSWGRNIYGTLGLDDITNRSDPTQVGNLTNWASISGQTAIKTNGTMWAWGYNGNGDLGLGDITHRSSPVQIGALTTWSKISGSSSIKTDGTLWTWGYNATGQLGLSNTTYYSSPKQVGSKTSWTDVFKGIAVFAIG